MTKNLGLPSRYRNITPIGSGGIGTVYSAIDSGKDHQVAIKILNNIDPSLSASIKKEFSTLVTLKHPNLISVYDFGQSDSGHLYFSMEYVKGPNLYNYFKIPDNVVGSADILLSMLDALNYLARKDILHGDVKPENILISINDGAHPKLVDFGLCTIADTKSDSIFGTPRFIAPEILASKHYSQKSDLYALGHSFIESLLQNHTPLAENVTKEYLSSAQESLSQLFNTYGVQYPINLSSFIVTLSNPSMEIRPDTHSLAVQVLSTIVSPSHVVNKLDHTEHIVRAEIDNGIDKFIEDGDFRDYSLILSGPLGTGKLSLISRAISKAQLLNFRVLSFLGTDSDSFSLHSFVKTLSTNLSDATSKQLFENHQNLLKTIKVAEQAQDLDNIGVIYSNISDFIHELSIEHPVLIALSDIDQAGIDAINFFNHLLNEAVYLNSKIKFITSYSTDIPHTKDLFEHLNSLIEISKPLQTRGFNNDETKNLCQTLFNKALFSDTEIDNIVSITDGIPLYILDYLNYLFLNDIVTLSDGKYDVDHKALTTTRSTTKFGTVVDKLVSDISANQLHLLQLLSIFNKPLIISAIDEFLPYDALIVAKECEQAGLLIFNGINIQLISPILNNHLSNSRSQSQSTNYHKILAQYIELTDPYNHHGIANHYINANQLEEAYKHSLLALEHHLSNHEYYAAYSTLSSLYRLYADEADSIEKITTLKKLSSLEFTLGYLDDSLTHYRELIDIDSNDIAISTYYTQIGRIEYFFRGNTDRAVESFQKGLELANRNSALEVESKILIFIGLALKDPKYLEKAASISKDIYPKLYTRALGNSMYLYTFSGSTSHCRDIDEKLNKFLSHDDLEILTDVYYAKYIYAFYTGKYELADEMIRHLIEVSKKANDEMKRIRCLNALGSIHYAQGQFIEQIDVLSTAHILIKKYQASGYIINSLSNMALAHTALANYSEAIRLIQETNKAIQHFQISDISPNYYSTGAGALFHFGELYTDEISHYLMNLKENARKSKNIISLGHLELTTADSYLYKMLCNISIEHYMKALNIFQEAQDMDDSLESLLKLSLVYRLSENNTSARKYAKQAAKIFREINCGYLKPLYSYVIALTEYHDNPGSLAPLLEAIEISKAFGTREWTWQIQFHVARYSRDAGDIATAVKYSREAINTLKEITESFDSQEQISSYLQVPLRNQVFKFVKELRS